MDHFRVTPQLLLDTVTSVTGYNIAKMSTAERTEESFFVRSLYGVYLRKCFQLSDTAIASLIFRDRATSYHNIVNHDANVRSSPIYREWDRMIRERLGLSGKEGM